MNTAQGRNGQNNVQSVGRALDLLEALADPRIADPDVGLVGVANAVGLQASTAHRILATLIRRGYVTRNRASGGYLLGPKVPELASTLQNRTASLRSLCRPHLERIRTETGESVTLVLLSGDQAVFIDQVEGLRQVGMFLREGFVIPAHVSAAGKAILAFQPIETVKAVLAEAELVAMTAKTITSKTRFLEELRRVRSRGFAIDNEEYEEGASCVAAPILFGAVAVAALSVTGPTTRILHPSAAILGQLLTGHATEISASLNRY